MSRNFASVTSTRQNIYNMILLREWWQTNIKNQITKVLKRDLHFYVV